MAVPSYTTDLTTIVDFDGVTGTISEPSTGWTAGRSPTSDTDFPIQSSNHGSLTMNTTGDAGLMVTGSTFTWTSGHYLFGWIIWLAPGAIDTKANGGLVMLAGNTTGAYKVFYVGGKDFGSYPYGGWQNFAVDPELTGDESNVGSPNGTQFMVVGCGGRVLSAVSKGNPLGMDAFRYGRGEFRVAGGQSGNYATFDGMATANDATAAKWGLLQKIEGGFKFKGLMTLGYGALTEFIDSNKSIVIDVTTKVNSSFNKIEIKNASSIVTLTNIAFTQLGIGVTYPTVSVCAWEVIDNATVTLDSCIFTDMSTFIFQSNTTIQNGTTFRRCGQITQGGASFNGALITATTATYALNASSPNDLDNVSFTNNGTALYIPASVTGSVTLDGCLFSGNTTDIYWAGTGGTLTINKVNGSNPSTWSSAGGTVSIVASSSINIHVQNEAKADLVGAYVYINDDDTGAAEVNDTTDSNGDVSTSYAGAASAAILRVRKYGYKPFNDDVDLSSDITRTVTMIADPQQT